METEHSATQDEVMTRYGIPYQGSKNKLARWVVECLPAARHFYDLFCGGGAVTHAALLSRKYQHIHMNDLDGMMAVAFVDCVNGKYAGENRWISHEEFMRLRDTDLYAAICFSFGNNRRSYAYDRKKEPWKRALHYAVYFDDCQPLKDFGVTGLEALDGVTGTRARYEALRLIMKRQYPKERMLHELESAERFQFVQSLERLQSLAHTTSIDWTNTDYAAVEIEPESIVYCDIPYKGTNGYVGGAFDWTRFYEWALSRPFPVFVSEYTMPGGFAPIAIKKRTGTMCANDNKQIVAEKIFVQTQYADRFRRDLFV